MGLLPRSVLKSIGAMWPGYSIGWTFYQAPELLRMGARMGVRLFLPGLGGNDYELKSRLTFPFPRKRIHQVCYIR